MDHNKKGNKQISTVQLNCNFTHVWWSTHGYMQIFTCKIQKFLWKTCENEVHVNTVCLDKKTKKMCGTQVCYLLVPQICQIQPSVSPKLLSRFLPNLYIFALHIHYVLHISKLKEIASAVFGIFVPKNCPIFFTFFFFSFFFSLHKIANAFKSHKTTFPCFNFS